MTAPAASSIFAVEFLAELVRRGVQDVVVCPGSRSQALALAAAAAEQAGAIRLHVRVDERSAGFFALGVARETGLPAPVVVTSGSAVAHLLPAALEAHESRVPMMFLTADRPADMRGVRANQTTDQAHMLGQAARLSLDIPSPEYASNGDLVRTDGRDPATLAPLAFAASLGMPGRAPAGPVQLNLAFTEPLSGTRGFDAMIAQGFVAAAAEGQLAREQRKAARGQAPSDVPQGAYVHEGDALAVVIAGAEAGPEAEEFAHAAGLPLLAEAVSGSRYGREAIAGYATLIDDPNVGALVEQAIVFGHPTLTRQIPALLKRDDVEVIVVDPHTGTDHYDPSRDARVVREARVGAGHDPRALRGWLGAWLKADRELQRERTTVHERDIEAAFATGYKERSSYARAEVAVMREPVTREMLAESVWRASWPHDRLVVAASSMVRVLDRQGQPRKVNVHANRGLAGIEGTVATARGVAAASQLAADPRLAAGTTRVLIGDLALLHDAGSLMLTDGEPRPRLQLFVANDGGGSIFDGLEVAESTNEANFARVMSTPQQLSLAQLAQAYGWDYLRVETRGELEELLTAQVTGPTLIEIPIAR